MKTPVHLDYSGTTPRAREVIEAMRPYLEEVFGNLAAITGMASAKRGPAISRNQIASLLDCSLK